MIVCIGPTGSGKTTLLRRLQQYDGGESPSAEMPSTVPTTGVDVSDVRVGRQTFRVREIGGAMAPLWAQQCSEAAGLIYVVDSANLQQFGAALVQLLDLLTLPTLREVPFLLVFGKTDVRSGVSPNETKSAFRLNDILRHAEQPVDVVDASSLTGYGLGRIVQWLRTLQTSSK